jgi:hypothetical protein
MIRDMYLRLLFIPLLGIAIPYISGAITYRLYSTAELLGINCFFVFTSFIIWRGSNWIHAKLRTAYIPVSKPFARIAGVSLSSSVYGAAVGGFSILLWFRFSKENFLWVSFYKFIAVCVFAVIVFTLIYEILFLSKERELDSKLVTEMDKELTQAELTALHNEMDPHFIFNSLNAMGTLIMNNPMQAHLFNSNLSLVYKYFLINKNKELIPLNEELEFLDNYFFLLQIRYDNKLRLQVDSGLKTSGLMIPPCALQLLLENAIKHNAFSDTNPLNINIVANGQYVKVSNTLRPKPYAANSTHTGLKNLSSRFRLITKKDIVIESGAALFTVKLPIIKET